MKTIPIYNRITLNINKEMLDTLTELVLLDKERVEEQMKIYLYHEEDEKELKMLEDLYSTLIVLNKTK